MKITDVLLKGLTVAACCLAAVGALTVSPSESVTASSGVPWDSRMDIYGTHTTDDGLHYKFEKYNDSLGDVYVSATITGWEQASDTLEIPAGFKIEYDSGLAPDGGHHTITTFIPVRKISYGAFRNCKELRTILGLGTVDTIEAYAFSGCTGLTEINIPEGVETIEAHAFDGCTGLTEINIPESVKSLSGFSNCTGLTSVTIPESVETIGSSAFSGCTGLIECTIPYGVKEIGDEAFSGCTGLPRITIPYTVERIGKGAFGGCEALKKVSIPHSVTDIGYGAFAGCTKLSEVTLSESITRISGAMFRNCTSLTEFVIPDGVTEIDDYAFEGCTGLKSLTIPYTTKYISETAFRGCVLLTELLLSEDNRYFTFEDGLLIENETATLIWCMPGKTSVTIPDTVTAIGGAFCGNEELIEIIMPDSITEIPYGAFSGCTSLEKITIPNNVTSIGRRAFSACTSLEKITIPNSVTSIGAFAFSDCTSLKELVIPEGVERINEGTFWRCSALKSLTIPYTVEEIQTISNYWGEAPGISAFEGCDSLTELIVSDYNLKYLFRDGLLIERDAAKVVWCAPGKSSVIIPKGITTIGFSAFYGKSELTEIVIPDSVTTIYGSAFGDCEGLTKIHIPASVTEISGTSFSEGWVPVFHDCTSLTEITVAEDNPNYASDDGMLLSKDKTELYLCPAQKTSCTVPDSVTKIDYYASRNWNKNITIMNPLCEIRYVPTGCTLYGHAGSTAQTYAQEHEGVTFRLIGEAPSVSLYGDADCNGELNIMDVILLNRNLMIGAEISEQGMLNSDVDNSGSADAVDSLNMLKAVVKLITLPV